MKKKETRWISRDMDGKYDVWKIKPRWSKEDGQWECIKNHSTILRDAELNERQDVTLKRGGLAKLTIKRQY